MPRHDLSQFDDMVVFNHADGTPFSNDPRWSIYEHLKAENDHMDEVDHLDDEPPYDRWTNDELRAELSARKLDTTGKKVEMVARLEKWDEEHPEPEDEE